MSARPVAAPESTVRLTTRSQLSSPLPSNTRDEARRREAVSLLSSPRLRFALTLLACALAPASAAASGQLDPLTRSTFDLATVYGLAPAPDEKTEPSEEEPDSEAADEDEEGDEDADESADENEAGDASEGDASALPPGTTQPASPLLRPNLSVPPQPAVAVPTEENADSAETTATPEEEDAPDLTADLAATGPEIKLEKPELLRKRIVPPFWVDREFTTHRTRALTLPPLFVHRTPKEGHPDKLLHWDLSMTVGFYSKRRQRRIYIAPLALFGGAFSERASGWFATPLLMGYKRTGEAFNFGQFPFVWWWGNKHVRNLIVVPFHYRQKTPESTRGASGLLVWYGKKNLQDTDPLNDRKYFLVAPLFYRVQLGMRLTDVFVPLYFGGENKLKGIRHHSFIPLFHWQKNEFGNRRELWTIPFIRRTDKARRKSAWAVPPLLTFQSKGPHSSLTSATPLVWHATNQLKASATTVAGPFVLHRDPRQRNSVFFPLWWQFSDKQRGVTDSVVFPLAYARKTPTQTGVFTLLGGGAKAKDGWNAVVPPLFTSIRKRETGPNHQVVTPLFWHFHNDQAFAGKGRDTLLVPPLVYRDRRGDERRFGLPALMTFTGRGAGVGGHKSYQVVTPLFWRFRDRDPLKDSHTIVAGPVYAQRKKTGWLAGLPPLFFLGSDDQHRYTVVPPLLFGDVTDVQARTRTTISPLFVRSAAPGRRTVGAALLGWDVLREDQRHSVFFPLYYRRQTTLEGGGEQVLTLTPLGGGKATPDKRTWAALLAYGTSNRKTGDARARSFGMIPLFFHDTRPLAEGGRARTTVVPGLTIVRRHPEQDLDMYTPLVWRSTVRTGKPRKGLVVFPFYFRQRQPGGVDVDAGVPFFYSRDRTRRTHTLIGGPFFHRLSRTQLNTGLLPVYWWMDSETKRRLISLPVIIHTNNKETNEQFTFALPFWFDRRKANGSRTWVAFPFVFGSKGLFNYTRAGIAPPLFFDIFRVGKNYRFTGFIPLLFRYQKNGFQRDDDPKSRYTLWGSFPLFMYGKDGLGRRTHSALGLYYADKDADGRKFYTWLFGFNMHPKTRKTWYALNFGQTVTTDFRETLVLPAFYRKKFHKSRDHTTVFLPPLFIGKRKKEYRWFQSTLLVWHFRRPHKVTTAVVPPIFYSSHTYAKRRLTWVAPFFIRDNKMDKDTVWTAAAAGLYVQRRKGENLDFVQFPLLWHIERGDRQGTVGGLLWWDIRKGENTTQVVPALFTRRKTAKRATNVVGPGLGWWWRKGADGGDGLHWRALFGIIGGGNEAGKRYFSLFGGRIKLKPKPVKPRRWQPKRSSKQVIDAEATEVKTGAKAEASSREGFAGAKSSGGQRSINPQLTTPNSVGGAPPAPSSTSATPATGTPESRPEAKAKPANEAKPETKPENEQPEVRMNPLAPMPGTRMPGSPQQ